MSNRFNKFILYVPIAILLLYMVVLMSSCNNRKVHYRCSAVHGDGIIYIIKLDSAYKAGDVVHLSLVDNDNPSGYTDYLIERRAK